MHLAKHNTGGVPTPFAVLAQAHIQSSLGHPYEPLVTLGLALSGWHFARLAVENVVYGGKVRIQHPSACSNQSLSLLGIFHIAEPDSALAAAQPALSLWKQNGP
ncbi:hypothetical protein ROHU_014433 [Labeo rohita]|uniref:Uncharacterized protein n=1 Tax=Labeo rohita TaxID=84645 RepID=A0A498NQT7_LABRO|nr:hypothetical protein ROHU_004235 [Labeo rohita]RXN35194.1 hypothetical protein ROHU_014433 [Labeo rohita]